MRETKNLICAAQERAIRTNLIKGKIDKSQKQTKCRMCSRADEKINHIVGECLKLAQKECKRRHEDRRQMPTLVAVVKLIQIMNLNGSTTLINFEKKNRALAMRVGVIIK